MSKKINIWFVYILRCADGTLYTGITTDLARRVKEHNTGKAGARYTRSRRPVVLVYSEAVENRSEASKREHAIKKLKKKKKMKMAGL
ncbi:MAG TPA: GIY-YIG nuclease family protein [Pseudomonadales bacterium]|nr:GIY-YIG nuclease family protein [Pseudomonadales bacterium]